MNNKLSRMLALAMAGALVLSGCGGSEQGGNTNSEGGSASAEENSKERITDLALPVAVSRELETFNILYSQRGEDSENLTNLVDGLLEVDEKGKLVPCIAEEWGTEDNGLTWTFKIRQGVKWVDVNATRWQTVMHRTLLPVWNGYSTSTRTTLPTPPCRWR